MFYPRFAGRYTCRAAGRWLCSIFFAWAALTSPVSAASSCLISPDPAIRELQNLVDADAGQALKKVRAQLDALERAPQTDAQRLASLYAVQARAYTILELDDAARSAASKGLKFATLASDPVHLDLLSAYAVNVYDASGLDAALHSIESARAGLAAGSLADTCLLITLGELQYRQDRHDLAISSLTQAYRASTAPEFAVPRIVAAAVLSTVMRSMGDYPQALALNQEVIDWDSRRGATLSLSVDRFLRGKILNLAGQYTSAIGEFTEARKLSIQVNDTLGIAFADLLNCTARIELGQLDLAAAECNSALRAFTAAHTADEVKEARRSSPASIWPRTIPKRRLPI